VLFIFSAFYRLFGLLLNKSLTLLGSLQCTHHRQRPVMNLLRAIARLIQLRANTKTIDTRTQPSGS
jgi:hypothetical protein